MAPLIAAWRPAPVTCAPRCRRLPLRVVAFRDAHRTKQLVDTATEFARSWATGHREGPTKPVMQCLEQICAKDVHFTASRPMGAASAQGLDSLRTQIEHTSKDTADLSRPVKTEVEVTLAAANDETETAFCLVCMRDVEYSINKQDEEFVQSVKGKSETYMILKMNLKSNEGSRRVTRVLERCQATGGATATAAGPATAHRHEAAMGSAMAPFPRDLVQPWPQQDHDNLDPCTGTARIKSVLSAWVRSRVGGIAGPTAQDNEFQLMDANSDVAIPFLYQLTATNPDAVTNLEKAYEVDCQLLDSAVCLDEAAAFAHWKAKLRSRTDGSELEAEGMEVDLQDPSTGNLRAVYLFGDGTAADEHKTKTQP